LRNFKESPENSRLAESKQSRAGILTFARDNAHQGTGIKLTITFLTVALKLFFRPERTKFRDS
jgi:hypothetical protein